MEVSTCITMCHSVIAEIAGSSPGGRDASYDCRTHGDEASQRERCQEVTLTVNRNTRNTVHCSQHNGEVDTQSVQPELTSNAAVHGRNMSELVLNASLGAGSQQAETRGLSAVPILHAAAKETVDKEVERPIADLPSTVRVKEEVMDKGYERAAANCSVSITAAEVAQLSAAASGQNASTAVIRKGRKRVKVTIVRGDWRTTSKPRQNKQKSQAGNSLKQRGDVSKPPSSVVPERRQMRPRRQTAKTVAKPTGSAVPIGLYRNVHIKTEPEEDGCTDPDWSSFAGTEQQQAVSSTSSYLLQMAPSSQVLSVSSSEQHHGEKGRWRKANKWKPPGKRRFNYHPASASLIKAVKQDNQDGQMQHCTVQLQRLSADMMAAGTVNLQMHPQVLQEAAAIAVAISLRKRPRDCKRPWACELCGKTYKTKSSRNQHYKIHNDTREHVCALCGAAFNYRSVLTAHCRFVHGGERPYQCSVCSKSFAYSSHLANHERLHFQDKAFTCPICHKQFYPSYVKEHLATHSNMRHFHCDICNKRYKSRRSLQIHQTVHSGHKPYKCHRCSQQFSYSSSLNTHLRVHTGERPYQCYLCPSKFSQSTHLGTHLRGVHKLTKLPCLRQSKQ